MDFVLSAFGFCGLDGRPIDTATSLLTHRVTCSALGILVTTAPGLAGLAVLLSSLTSNIPVVLFCPLIPTGDTQGWLLLATAPILAGNLTLLGSVANLNVADAARREGFHLSFGLTLRFLTLLLAFVWIQR